MRIQNNITAMNTHRMYTTNNSAVAKSAEKLSSGYRINRAGDDAAGLAISEKMRSQIRGLNMASKNSQDAVSLIQTAEGALQEVHSMLQRMNELANQAATGTNQAFDRDQINAEFNQLKDEINQIAETTQFNQMKLLDGSLASDAAKVSISTGSSLQNGKTLMVGGGTAGTDPSYTVTNHTGLSDQEGSYAIEDLGNGKIKVTFTEAKTGNVTKTDIDLKDVISNSASQKGAEAIGAGKSFDVDLSAAGLGTYTITSDNSTTPASINDLAAALSTGTVKTGLGATSTTGTAAQGQASIELDSAAIAKALAAKGLDPNKQYRMSLNASGDDLQLSYEEVLEGGGFGAKTVLASVTLTDSAAAAYTAEIKADDGSVLATVDVATGTANDAGTTATAIGALNGDLGLIGASGGAQGGLKIQVGANEGEQLTISVASMSTKGLGIDKNSIGDQVKAGEAITATQKAVNIVSEQRATLGAMQNRLEHKIANLDNTSENLSAAESRIRDVDIAKEMTAFTKNNILSQAATAMLAQANAAPQGVLSLLQ